RPNFSDRYKTPGKRKQIEEAGSSSRLPKIPVDHFQGIHNSTLRRANLAPGEWPLNMSDSSALMLITALEQLCVLLSTCEQR
ncbi:MAG TPA: hypothetical protein VKK81_20460, partial [Candidatus Binatia bacterium]|nr:hypothetical protein [Candidatus Binatia bacterium]